MPAPDCPPPARSATRLAALLAVSSALLLPLAACHPGGQSPDRMPGGPGSGAGTHAPPSARGDGAAQVVRARSLRVQDGDSFIAATGSGARRTIRLTGIDAPERYQAHADRSRRHLSMLLADRELDLHVRGTDRYGRMIAQVFTASGPGKPVDVGLAQIEAGMAWFFRRYQRDLPPSSRERYEDAERNAREAGKGLWQTTDPEPPWNFRRRGPAVIPDAGR